MPADAPQAGPLVDPVSGLDTDRRASIRAKIELVFVLGLFAIGFAATVLLLVRRALSLAHARDIDVAVTDLYLFSFTHGLVFVTLVGFPLMLSVGYRGLHNASRARRLSEVLGQCGLDAGMQRIRMQEHGDRTGLSAFLLPMLVNLALLALVWSIVLLPQGLSGMYQFLQPTLDQGRPTADLFPRIAADASPLAWTLLGAYFYSVTVLFRRWLQSDLSASMLWWVNVRLVVALVLGLLLTSLSKSVDGSVSGLGPWVGALAFFVGILPDMLLRWLRRQLWRLFRVENTGLALFGSPDLQRAIPGMSFWQVDRLAEEGITSIGDLAMQDLSSLLIRTRFAAPLVMYWVDRALLCDVAGDVVSLLDRVQINRATQLVSMVRNLGVERVAAIVRDAASSVAHAQPRRKLTPRMPSREFTAADLRNIVALLEAGPNLRELLNYADFSAPAASPTNDRQPASAAPEPHPGTSEHGPRDRSRATLAVLLFLVLSTIGVAAHSIARQAVIVAAHQQTGLGAVDVYGFAFAYGLLLLLLVALPLLLVLGYHGIKSSLLEAEVRRTLTLCGLGAVSLKNRIQEFREQQGLWSYLLPVLVSLALSMIVWVFTLMPHSLGGLIAGMAQDNETPRVGIAMAMVRAAGEATPHTWILLGGYFYGIAMLLQRWIRSELNNACIWRFNLRLVVVFVAGLLLMSLLDAVGVDLGPGATLISGFAFAAGLVPDSAFRWIALRLHRMGATDAEADALFAASDLRRQIPTMSFWQCDRFSEQGIDSIQDLALTDIPELLMRTPLDALLLMRLVDRALLIHQAGDDAVLFRRAHIDCATAVMWLSDTTGSPPADDARLLASLNQPEPPSAAGLRGRPGKVGGRNQETEQAAERVPGEPPSILSGGQLISIRTGLSGGPNLRCLTRFWGNLRSTRYSMPLDPYRTCSRSYSMIPYRVIVDALELRAGPGTDYAILEQLPHGTELEPVPPSPHWTKVRRVSDGRIGWVYNAYIRPTQPEALEPAVSPPSPAQLPATRPVPAPAPPRASASAPKSEPEPVTDQQVQLSAPDGADLVFDISHFQPNVDFANAYAGGLRAVFHKASEGLQFIDPRYASSRQEARAAGLLWGAYHFGTGDDALAQAEHFLSVAKPDGETLLVLDLERNPSGASMSIEQARTFVSHVQQVTGKWPGLYSGSYIRDHLGNMRDPVLGNCWFWLAEYGPEPHVPPSWRAWSLWQHTDGHVGPGPHTVPGAGPCDRDRFAGDEQALQAFWAAHA